MRPSRPCLVLLAMASLLVVGNPAAPWRGASQTTAAAQARSGPDRPNVLLILADDLTVRQFEEFMPRTRSLLGDAGTVYSQAIVTFPSCCPSRATLLTGQYPHNHGVRSGSPPSGGYGKLDHTNTLATWLDSAGYHTAHVGKYLNGYGAQAPPDVPPGWDEWFALVDLQPSAQLFYEFQVFDGGEIRSFESGPQEHRSTVLTQRALEALDSAAASGEPFFLHFAPGDPHLGYRDRAAFEERPSEVERLSDVPDGIGWIAPESYRGRLEGAEVHWPANFNEADISDKPGLRQRDRFGSADVDEIAKWWNDAGETLLALDDTVEALVGRLADLGVLESTVIIFTSDNGVYWGEHRLAFDKFAPYEEAIRVPLLVRGPGFRAGETEERIVANVDLAPTIASVAGVAPDLAVDGTSLLELSGDPDSYSGRAVLIETVGSGQDDSYLGVRTANHAYIEYSNGERELYDLEADPQQLENIAGSPAVSELEAQLAERIRQLSSCSGGECLGEESSAPVADAGADRSVASGESFELSGTGSSDPDGDELTYQWELLEGEGPDPEPSGEAVVVLTAPEGPATLLYRLTVTDADGNSSSDLVVVSVAAPPGRSSRDGGLALAPLVAAAAGAVVIVGAGAFVLRRARDLDQ